MDTTTFLVLRYIENVNYCISEIEEYIGFQAIGMCIDKD